MCSMPEHQVSMMMFFFFSIASQTYCPESLTLLHSGHFPKFLHDPYETTILSSFPHNGVLDHIVFGMFIAVSDVKKYS